MLAIPAGSEEGDAEKKKNVEKASKSYPAKYRYTIRKLDGSTIKIVTEKDFFARLDCVAIEQGYSYNLRLVSDEICRKPDRDPTLVKKQQARANDCVQAKRQMIIAQTDREIMTSRQTVEVSCQFSRKS